MTIADIQFSFQPSEIISQLSSYFESFIAQRCNSGQSCEVKLLGESDALESDCADSDAPWKFSLTDQKCIVSRRALDGALLWRMRGDAAFEEVEVAWQTNAFENHYGSLSNALAQGLGIALLSMRLRTMGGLMFHGVAADVDGDGVLGLGVSGVGKSTLARLLRDAGQMVLTDERPALRPTTATNEPNFRIHGTPWPSSAGIALSASTLLKRVYFLEHGAENRITPLSPADAFMRLIPVTTIPWQNPEMLQPSLSSIEALTQSIRCATLSFRPTPEVVDSIRADLRA